MARSILLSMLSTLTYLFWILNKACSFNVLISGVYFVTCQKLLPFLFSAEHRCRRSSCQVTAEYPDIRRASASKQCTDKGKSQRHTGTSQDVRSEAHWLLILIQIGQRPGVSESRGWWWRRRLVNDSFCCRRPLLPRISDDCPATLDGWLCQCDYWAAQHGACYWGSSTLPVKLE